MADGDVAEIGATYFEAWQAGDFDRLRTILADDVTFDGPLGKASNADECIAGLQGMSQIVTAIVIHKTFVDGPDVLTWFDLYTAKATAAMPTVNWRHIENGKITWIRVTFDPRPLTSGK
ncbi:MAG TPA: nuclear transport factor 2 family protein [Streptosporangiaceae bacterium]|nr:nuclear transport factor 2 family protein [Streptosporangiaceae bacterium]